MDSTIFDRRRPGFWLMVVACWISGLLGLARADESGSSLQQLADRLDARLESVVRQQPGDRLVIAIWVEADTSIMGREFRLVRALEKLLVYRLESNPLVDKVVTLRERDKENTSGADLLLRCTMGIDGKDVHVGVDATPIAGTFWSRLAGAKPSGTQSHVFATSPVDEEVRLLLGKYSMPKNMNNWRIREMAYIPQRVIDTDCGDLDGDGDAELVVLTDSSLLVYAVGADKVQPVGEFSLKEIPFGDARTRDVSGNVLVHDFNLDGKAEIFFKTFDRLWGHVLTFDGQRFSSVRRLSEVPLCVLHQGRRPVLVLGTPEKGTNFYRRGIDLVDINRSAGKRIELQGPFTDLTCWQAQPAGSRHVLAAHDNSQLVEYTDDWKGQLKIENIGADIGLADFDGDGLPEVVVSNDGWPGEPDGVRVISGAETVWGSNEVIGYVVALGGFMNSIPECGLAIFAALEPAGRASRIYGIWR